MLLIKSSLKTHVNSNEIGFKRLPYPQGILPLTLGNTAVTKTPNWNGRSRKRRFLSRHLRTGSFLVLFQGFGLKMSGGRGHYQHVITRKEGCCHHAFIPPILEANTAHKPCCHTACVAPRSCCRRIPERVGQWS